MGEYYRELEKRPTIETVVDKVDDLNRKIASQSSKIEGLAQTVSQQGAKIDGLSQTIAKQSDKIDDLGRQLAKTNKRLAVGVTIASLAAGAVGYLLGNKSKEESKSVEQKTEVPVLPEQKKTGDVSEKQSAQTTAAVDYTKNAKAASTIPQVSADSTSVTEEMRVQTEGAEKVTEEANANDRKTSDANQPFSIDTDGKYLTKDGDTFWNIAKRYLESKFKDEPEKFVNLPKQRKDAIIQKECERIMKQNGYWYDENHNLPVPMLHQKIVLETAEKFDKAA